MLPPCYRGGVDIADLAGRLIIGDLNGLLRCDIILQHTGIHQTGIDGVDLRITVTTGRAEARDGEAVGCCRIEGALLINSSTKQQFPSGFSWISSVPVEQAFLVL